MNPVIRSYAGFTYSMVGPGSSSRASVMTTDSVSVSRAWDSTRVRRSAAAASVTSFCTPM